MEPGLLKSADWPLLIDLYFFLGGVAGGAFVLATVASMLDAQRHREIVRIGYYIALLAIIPCPIFLIVDLGLPSRFLHMLLVSKPTTEIGMGTLTVGPLHLKPFSPMSVGAWGLLVFSACAFLTALLTFLEDRGNRTLGGPRTVIGIVGSIFGFFVAAYPGVLLGATARPLFINAHWLGALFLVVGASTGGAAIALILSLMGGGRDSLPRLMKVTTWALLLESLFLILFIVTVFATGTTGVQRALGELLAGRDAILFWLGAVVIGLVVPLALQFGGIVRKAAPGVTALVSALVLVGGFLVKYVLIASGQRLLS